MTKSTLLFLAILLNFKSAAGGACTSKSLKTGDEKGDVYWKSSETGTYSKLTSGDPSFNVGARLKIECADGTFKEGVCESGGWTNKVVRFSCCKNVDCGSKGSCIKGKCSCNSGYTGASCETKISSQTTSAGLESTAAASTEPATEVISSSTETSVSVATIPETTSPNRTDKPIVSSSNSATAKPMTKSFKVTSTETTSPLKTGELEAQTTRAKTTLATSTAATDKIVDNTNSAFDKMIPWQDFPPQRADPLINVETVIKRFTDFMAHRIAPPVYDNKSIQVQVGFQVNTFREVNNIEETISTTGILVLAWSVGTCPNDTVDIFTARPYENVYVADPNAVWVPKLRFLSSATSDVYMEDKRSSDDLTVVMKKMEKNVSTNRTFQFFWTREGAFDSSCSLDLAKFPFDKQSCEFVFTLQRSRDLVKFSIPIFLWSPSATNNEWHVLNSSVATFQRRFNSYMVDCVRFQVELARIPDYHIQNLMIPTGILGLLTLSSFFLPLHSGNRAMFTVTLVLVIIFSQAGVLEEVPKKPDPILLIDYFQQLTWFSAGCNTYQLLMLLLANTCSCKNKEKTCCNKHTTVATIIDNNCFLLATIAFAAIHVYLTFKITKV